MRVELLLVDSARCDNDVIGDETDRVDHFHPHHMQTSQPLFPSSICAAAIDIIHLLEDVQVNSDGVAGTTACRTYVLCSHTTLRYVIVIIIIIFVCFLVDIFIYYIMEATQGNINNSIIVRIINYNLQMILKLNHL